MWTSSAHSTKVRETLFTYSGGVLTQTVQRQYDGAGVLLATLTKVFTYSGDALERRQHEDIDEMALITDPDQLADSAADDGSQGGLHQHVRQRRSSSCRWATSARTASR